MTGSLKHSPENRSDFPETDYLSETSDHEGVQSMAEGKTYEPGPSFVDDDQPDERLIEMPAWLQSFAAQEGHAGEDLAAEESAPSDLPETEPAHEQVDEPESSLPDWLRSDAAEEVTDFDVPQDSPAPELPASFVDDTSNPDGFISEDDLPDWLRAFSDDSPVAAASAPPVASIASAHGATSEGAAVVRVPPVENIWLSANEKQSLGPGGTLFALLASNNGSEATRDYDSPSSYSAPDGDAQRSNVVASKQSAATSNSESQNEEAAPSSSMRLILLTLLIVLLVVAISFWQFS